MKSTSPGARCPGEVLLCSHFPLRALSQSVLQPLQRRQGGLEPVSYTHLDVYKRQDLDALDIESTEEEIMEMIQQSGRSRLPVYEENADTILGILNARDYLLDRSAGKKTPLKELLRPAYFVPETIKADNLFKEMQKEKVHIAIVVDEYGGTEGIITMEDLLEEIVGNIYDEFDQPEQPEVVALGENQWRIAGSTPISTLVDDLELPLPESDDYDTPVSYTHLDVYKRQVGSMPKRWAHL